jgi:hypothetical protein
VRYLVVLEVDLVRDVTIVDVRYRAPASRLGAGQQVARRLGRVAS